MHPLAAKRCCACQRRKLLKHFSKNARNKDGLQDWCKLCFKEYHAQRYAADPDRFNGAVNAGRRLKIERVNEIKSIPCADCGDEFPPVCMDFDHVGSDKFDGISKMVRENRSWAVIEAEIAKCEIVCANCHRIRTSKRAVEMFSKL